MHARRIATHDSPFHPLARVEARRVLLDGHVGEMHVRVGDVLLLGRISRVCKAGKPTPAGGFSWEDLGPHTQDPFPYTLRKEKVKMGIRPITMSVN